MSALSQIAVDKAAAMLKYPPTSLSVSLFLFSVPNFLLFLSSLQDAG